MVCEDPAVFVLTHVACCLVKNVYVYARILNIVILKGLPIWIQKRWLIYFPEICVYEARSVPRGLKKHVELQ